MVKKISITDVGFLLPFAVLIVLQVLSLEARRLEIIDDLPPNLVVLLVDIAGDFL